MTLKLIPTLLFFSVFTGVQTTALALTYSEVDGLPLWSERGFTDHPVDVTVMGDHITPGQRHATAPAVNGTWTVSFTANDVSSQHTLLLKMPNACAPSVVVHSIDASGTTQFNIGMSIANKDGSLRLVLPFRIKDTAYLGVFDGTGDVFKGTVKDIKARKIFDATFARTSETSKLTSRAGQATFDVAPAFDNPPMVRDPLQGFMDIALVANQDEPERGFVCYGVHAKERFFYTATKLDITAAEQSLSFMVQFWDFVSSKALSRLTLKARKFDAPLRYVGNDEGGAFFLYFNEKGES